MIHRSPLFTLTLLALAFACSKQGEGQRCFKTNGNEDCDSNLECRTSIVNSCSDRGSNQATCNPDLCCVPSPQVSSIEKCNEYLRGTPTPTGTGGSGAGGGTSIVGETGGSAAAGDTSITPDAGAADAG